VRNVFVEKTLASTYKEAKRLVALAKALGGVNMVGYMKRFAVTFNKAKDLLDQEALGELISFDAYAYSSDFSGAKKDLQKSMARGGVLRDLGAHVVDLALFFFGDLHVSSAKLELFEEEGSEDSVCFKVEGSDGLEGRFDVSWCKENYRMPEFGLLVQGSKGVLRVNDDKVELEVEGERSVWYRHNLDDSVGFLLGAPEYFREDEYFINSALKGSGVNLDFSASSKVDYIIDQVKHAAGEDD
jgi:predicted dehydrogenase